MEGFEFKKKFGQNFLSDKNLLASIVEKSGTMCDDVVVEIGAGKGALTEELSKQAKKVFAFEIDDDLVEFLTNKFDKSNVELIFEDVMKFDDDKLNNIVGGRNNSTTIPTIKKICDGLEITVQEFFDSELFNNLEQEIK